MATQKRIRQQSLFPDGERTGRSPRRRDYAGAGNPNWRGGGEFPCAGCGRPVWLRPSDQAGRRFCGSECYAAWIAENGHTQPRYAGGPEKRACKHCKGEFLASRRKINQRGGSYCSRACATAGLRARVRLRCESCQGEFEVQAYKKDTARFCSRQCQHQSLVRHRTPDEIARNRLRKRMSSYIWMTLKHGKGKGGRTWEKLVGYTIGDLKRHIESLFLPGMSWDNMGQWHVDHRRPCSSFSYTSPEDPEFKECWALANLQPLWEFDNLSKGARYDPAP